MAETGSGAGASNLAMRILGLLGLVAVIAAGAEPERTLARAQAHLKRGDAALGAARAAKTAGQRLHALRRAEHYLRRADDLAAKTADLGLQSRARVTLVEAMVQVSGAYYERKSLPRAKEKVLGALALDPSSAKAKALLAAIEKAEDEDIFESVDGLVGIDRLQARRLEAGVPLRDRGGARRR